MIYAQEVEYIVKNSAKWREKISILSKVSGSIHPGELTALVKILSKRMHHGCMFAQQTCRL